MNDETFNTKSGLFSHKRMATSESEDLSSFRAKFKRTRSDESKGSSGRRQTRETNSSSTPLIASSFKTEEQFTPPATSQNSRQKHSNKERRIPRSLTTGSFDNLIFNPTQSVHFHHPVPAITPSDSDLSLPDELRLQDWYVNLKVNGKPFDRSRHAVLTRLRRIISECRPNMSAEVLNPLFSSIREQIHAMQLLQVDDILLKKSRILEIGDGLPRIFHHQFNRGIDWPFDIIADSKSIFLKWRRHDLNSDLLRGIIDGKKIGGRYTSRLDENYPNRMVCNFYGQGHLVSGDWFPSQLCALRDGAHGSAQAGIHGHPGTGAYSIVLSGGHYDDQDEGEQIVYCGTQGSNNQPTDATSRMMESVSVGNPIRVLRSHGLPEVNPYRPAKGLRYDGLYKAVGHKLLDEVKQHYQFLLRRLPDQGPIRFQGPYRKPTQQELTEYNKHRERMG